MHLAASEKAIGKRIPWASQNVEQLWLRTRQGDAPGTARSTGGGLSGRSYRLDAPASVSYADVGCATTKGFPKRRAELFKYATRLRSGDGTFHLTGWLQFTIHYFKFTIQNGTARSTGGGLSGRSYRLDAPASVSYADVGCSTTKGFPKRRAVLVKNTTIYYL